MATSDDMPGDARGDTVPERDLAAAAPMAADLPATLPVDSGTCARVEEGTVEDEAAQEQTDDAMRATYAKTHAEMQRRRRVADETRWGTPQSFARAPGVSDPAVRNDAQTHFVWSASHDEMRPRARDARHPAIRVYGLFASAEEATEHAHTVARVDPSCSLMVSPTNEWTMLPRSAARLAAAEVHVTTLLGRHAARRERDEAEFSRNVEEKRGGVGKAEQDGAPPQARAPTDAAADVPPDAQRAPLRLGRDAEVRDQSLVTMTILADDVQEAAPEPIFRVHAAFANAADADAWARAAGDQLTDVHIDVVSTCEWLFIQDVTSEKVQKEVFRSEELDKIMQTHRNQPAQCENYRRWREEAQPA